MIRHYTNLEVCVLTGLCKWLTLNELNNVIVNFDRSL